MSEFGRQFRQSALPSITRVFSEAVLVRSAASAAVEYSLPLFAEAPRGSVESGFQDDVSDRRKDFIGSREVWAQLPFAVTSTTQFRIPDVMNALKVLVYSPQTDGGALAIGEEDDDRNLIRVRCLLVGSEDA